jgi:hypothetical protein
VSTPAPVRAEAASTPVTVVLEFEHGGEHLPLSEVGPQLRKLLSGTNLQVELRLRSELPAHAQFGEVVLFKMKGHCVAGSALPVDELSNPQGALAMTYMTDGEILPFGEVECDRVRQSLARLRSSDYASQSPREFGLALARVMAHEIYHMLSQSTVHTADGVTKESLSPRELVMPNMQFPGAARAAVGMLHSQ